MAAPLARADSLRTTDPGAALDLYGGRLDELDPGDAELVAWLAARRDLPAAFEPFFRAAFARAADDGLRRAAALGLASLAFRANQLENAAKFYGFLVREARGRDDELWLTALVNLAQVYRLGGRTCESLVLARRAAREAEAAGRPLAVAVGRLHVAGLLSDLEDADRLEPALAELRAALARVPEDEHDPVVALLALFYEARLQQLRGDLEAALAVLAEQGERATGRPELAPYLTENLVFRADLEWELGNYHAARRLLAEAERSSLDRPDFLLLLKRVRMSTVLAEDGPSAALPLARELLEALWEAWPRAGSGMIRRFASELGRFLMDEFDDVDDARHAFDLAARASLARMVEVDRSTRELPDVTRPTADDMTTLADYRARCVVEQKELLATVAGYLRSRAVSAADLIVANDMIAVCAWCERIRTGDGRWLPLAAYVPSPGQMDLTHGICPDCREKVDAARS